MQKLKLAPIQKIDYKTMEEIKKLRTNISFLNPEINVINIISAVGKEGKSLVSFWLAHTLAETGKKVVLVDGNLRKKERVNGFEIVTNQGSNSEPEAGDRVIHGNTLKKYLLNKVKKEEIVYESNVENLFLVLSGHADENASELLSSHSLCDFITYLKSNFDYVIIDTPAVGEVTDGVVIAKYCDGNLLVVEPGVVPYQLAQKVKEQIENSGSKVLGVVLNKV